MLDELNARYRRHVARLTREHPEHEAMALAVGGGFEAIGRAQLKILRAHGLAATDYLVDCGCGSGRLATALAEQAAVRQYLGIDVVPELVAHAASMAQQPGWAFEVTDGARIPEVEGVADFVVMFSLLTHLPHELTYVYLSEAHRVLRPDGRLVLSFLEFEHRRHWPVFMGMVETVSDDRHYNQFLERSVLRLWADQLGFRVESIRSGRSYVGDGSFEQSVCVLRRSPPARLGVIARALARRVRTA